MDERENGLQCLLKYQKLSLNYDEYTAVLGL